MAKILDFSLDAAEYHLPLVKIRIKPHTAAPLPKGCKAFPGNNSSSSSCSSPRFVVRGSPPVTPKTPKAYTAAAGGSCHMHIFMASSSSSEPGTFGSPGLPSGTFLGHPSGSRTFGDTGPGAAVLLPAGSLSAATAPAHFTLAPQRSGFGGPGFNTLAPAGRLSSSGPGITAHSMTLSSFTAQQVPFDSAGEPADGLLMEPRSLLTVSSLTEPLHLAPLASDATAGALLASKAMGASALWQSGAGNAVSGAVAAQGKLVGYRKAVVQAVQQQLEWKD